MGNDNGRPGIAPHEVILSLVSAQPTPNITPLLDPSFRPREVILLQSPDMKQRADWLEKVVKGSGSGVAVTRLEVKDPWDIEHVRGCVQELILDRSKDDLVLNATGGTKPMSIAAYEEFREFKLPIFYVHPERDCVVWLYPRGKPSHQLSDRVKLPAFLGAHGEEVESLERGPVSTGRQELARYLVDNAERLASSLATLNWYANEAASSASLVSPVVDERFQDSNSTFEELCGKFEAAGLFDWKDGRLRFAGEDARFFVNGGWLEEYVFTCVEGLRREGLGIQDVARGIRVCRAGEHRARVANEIDVGFLVNNRLYIIECKTRRFGKRPQELGVGAEAVYKLDVLGDLLGGLQARAMLASYVPLGDHDRARASDLGIRTVSGTQLVSLPRLVRDWIGR